MSLGQSVELIEFVIVDGKILANTTVDPTVEEVSVNGLALVTGSVLKNPSTGQKYLKVNGDSKAFAVIPIQVKPEWELSQSGSDAWDLLQNL